MGIQFINEKIIELESDNELRLDEIYYEYQNWFKQTKGTSVKCPSRKDVKANLTKKYGAKMNPSNKNSWIGLAIKESVA